MRGAWRITCAAGLVVVSLSGSGCSIQIAKDLVKTAPGTLEGLQLVVDDVDAARTELLERAVPASEIRHFEDGEWKEGRGGPWNSFIFFEDPDGNSWTVQERPAGESRGDADS